jgi:hypothetical protein
MMLSIYVSVKNALLNDGNIDEEERMHILTSFKDCMLKSFKENVDKKKKIRENLKDSLLKGLNLRIAKWNKKITWIWCSLMQRTTTVVILYLAAFI